MKVLFATFILCAVSAHAARLGSLEREAPLPHFLEMDEAKATPIAVEHIILCRSGAGSGVPIKGGLYEHRLSCTKWIKPSAALGILSSKLVASSHFSKTLSLFSKHQNEVKDGEAFVSCHLQDGGGVNPVNTQPKGAVCSPYLDKGGIVDYLGNNYVMKLKSAEDASGDPTRMDPTFTVCRGNKPSESNTLYAVRMKMECSAWISDSAARDVLNKSEESSFVSQRSLMSIVNLEKAISAAKANSKVSSASPVAIGNTQQYVVCKLPEVERGGAGDANAAADVMAPADCSVFGDAATGIKFLDAKKSASSTSGAQRTTFISIA